MQQMEAQSSLRSSMMEKQGQRYESSERAQNVKQTTHNRAPSWRDARQTAGRILASFVRERLDACLVSAHDTKARDLDETSWFALRFWTIQ